MCGIAGIYHFKKHISSEADYIGRCLQTMRHRGPDADGIFQKNNYVTGFVRLAIRDLSPAGNQPMLSACGNYCISFNGEIYNADSMRPALEKQGVTFRSTSDTEVLLYSLIEKGVEKTLAEADGIFAFAFYDIVQNKLIVARDRAGIKPLYIGFDSNQSIIYSSQYDHIINYASIRDEPLDAAATGAYLQLGYVPDNAGIVRNTFMLPHGFYATVNAGVYTQKPYFSFITNTKQLEKAVPENIFRNAVQSQLVSDVPVGCYLSGGVDSALVAGWANEKQHVRAYTVATDDAYTNEGDTARYFAEKCGIEQTIFDIDASVFDSLIDDYFIAHAEPFADFSSIPSLLLSKLVRSHCTVVLSGDGPDELFWGYERNIKYFGKAEQFFRSPIRQYGEKILSRVTGRPSAVDRRMLQSEDFFEYYYGALFLYGSVLVPGIFKPECGKAWFLEQVRNAYEQADASVVYPYIMRDMEMNINLQRILLKADRAGMYHSMEVRVPYLSNDVLDLSLHTGMSSFVKDKNGKYYLKELLAKKAGMGHAFKKKQGFLVPMRNWLREGISTDVYASFEHMPEELSAMFYKKQLMHMLDMHVKEGKDYSNIIWAVYALVKWYRLHRNNPVLSA